MIYTENSPWPYNDDEVCAMKWIFQNDDKDLNQLVEIYTSSDDSGAVFSLGGPLAILTALTLYLS